VRSCPSCGSSAPVTSGTARGPEHYSVVGTALIAAMASVAGDACTAEYELAWSEAFEIVANAMLEGAEAAALEQAA
jgi:hemoglobin-like flavoprotein